MIGMSREIYFVYLIALTNKHVKCLFLLLEGKIWFFTHILIVTFYSKRQKYLNKGHQTRNFNYIHFHKFSIMYE